MSFADDERIDWDEFVRKFYITGSVTLMQCRFLCSDIPITIGFCDGVLCLKYPLSLYTQIMIRISSGISPSVSTRFHTIP